MPELPEVETTRQGILPHLIGRKIINVICRTDKLRLPLQADLPELLISQIINTVERCGKYLLFRCTDGTLIVHLGMTGHLRLATVGALHGKHDHFEIGLDNGNLLRLHDSRKFGTVIWTDSDPQLHPLLARMGVEPLTDAFSAAYMTARCKVRRTPIKQLLMDNALVVGIGNIYASESLFRAGIHPGISGALLDADRWQRLVLTVKTVLAEAIELGRGTLAEYSAAEGKPGYFRLDLMVYSRAGDPCRNCGSPIQVLRQSGRSTYFCAVCQK